MTVDEIMHNPEWDAHTLAEAAAINSDPSRLLAAQQAANSLKERKEAEVIALEKVGKKVYDHPDSAREREKRKG
jgi:hypothetical protein